MQFVNTGRGCKRRPYGRGIPSGLMTALYVAINISFRLPHHVEVSLFIIVVEVCARVLRCCECGCCM